MIPIDPLANRRVLLRSMDGHLDRAISSDEAGELFPGCGRIVEGDGVAGRCVSGKPGRIWHQGDAPRSKFRRPGLPGRGDKPLRPLRPRLQRRPALRQMLTHIKAASGFAMRQIPCVTRWFAREGLTGFTKKHDMRLAMRDVTITCATEKENDMPTSAQIRRSVQRFGDYSGDLIRSDMNTFENALNTFLTFCETDAVFSAFHSQLQSVPGADFGRWYAERSATGGSKAGSCRLTFPTDAEVRMALMYELLRRIRDGRLDFASFTIQFFALGTNRITAYVQALNDAITRPLVRELTYRLEEVTERLPPDGAASIAPASIQIIHQATNVIQQSANGSHISQVATQQLAPELTQLLEALDRTLSELADAETQRAEYAELVQSVREMASAAQPKRSAIRALLGALPPVSAVLSITASILKLLGP